MKIRQIITKKRIIGILILLALIIVFSIVFQDAKRAIYFFALVYIATLVYLVASSLIKKWKGKKSKKKKPKEVSYRVKLTSIFTQIKQLRSGGKFTKEIAAVFLLPLSFAIALIATIVNDGQGSEIVGFSFSLTIFIILYLAIKRIFQKLMARKRQKSSSKEKADKPKTKILSRISRRKPSKKVVIGLLILLVLMIIIFLASQPGAVLEVVAGVGLTLAVIATLLFLVVDRFIQKRKVRELKEASLRAEVDSLKTQINPHFFFNTLNNLYGLTVEKSDMAPEVILKLSDMMRYTIYEGEKDRVALTDEITYIENFIELQKIRFHRELDVKFEHFIEEADIKVPPLLFIVLVENAFKHGAESLTGDTFIHMKLMSMEGSVLFEIQNNFEADEIRRSGGIGLKNLQRRLQLLFPEKHTLLLDGASNGVYKATLKFKMS